MTFSSYTTSDFGQVEAGRVPRYGAGPGKLAPARVRAETLVRQAQQSICEALEDVEGSCIVEDVWTSPDGSTEYTDRRLRNGHVFENVGVNVAVIHGTFSAETARAATGGSLKIDEPTPFYVASVQAVIHARNPMVPSCHAHYRYFEAGPEDDPKHWWFGGRADLTPYYLFDEDAAHFHRVHRQVCDRYDASYYATFKKWCDEYFHIVHRGEHRGVGGIFFDNLNGAGREQLFAFVAQSAAAFVPAYLPIVKERQGMPFTAAHEQWKQLRAGRYIEFNLVYERGTAFGLKSGGRAASVLMGLPQQARWEYQHMPAAGSEEARLLEVLRNPRDWA